VAAADGPRLRTTWRALWPQALLLATLVALALLVGRYPGPFWTPPWLLWQDDLAARVVWSLRFPRVLAAMLLGMSLSGAGIVLQTVFRNPLVEPGFLGVSQGAAFGASLAILGLGAGASPLAVEASALGFALAGLGLSYAVARRFHFGGWVLRLVLGGIAVSALFSAGVGIVKYLADPFAELPTITFWLLGSLSGVTWADVGYLLPFVLPGLAVVVAMRWRLNLLSLQDESAFSLGSALGRERALLLLGAVAAAAAVTAVGGIVGWIGLMVPHLARRAYGADSRLAVPAALLLGGSFAVVCDACARTLLAGEIPLGIVSSLAGAVGFVLLMSRVTLRVPR
jgi:iron complex transport system permease protein